MAITISPVQKSEQRAIKRLYKTAFPKNERAPFWMLVSRVKKRRAVLLCAKDGERLIGMAYLVEGETAVYLFYYAICGDCRGMGYGSKVLSELIKRYEGRKLFLSRETLDSSADNYSERLRRHSFYLRLGFEDQPELVSEGGVIFDTMSIGGRVTPDEYDLLITSWAGERYKKRYGMRMYLDEK